MTGQTIDATEVPRWAPRILISDQVTPTDEIEVFRYRAPARFTAPAILFSAPQPLFVTGDFTIVAEQTGLVPGSTYLAGEYDWQCLFDVRAPLLPVSDRTTLIAGNIAAHNHWHWVFQCTAPLLLASHVGLDDADAIVPELTPAMRYYLALIGVAADRLVELPRDAAVAPRAGVYSNLTSGDFAFAPHPRLVAAYEQIGRRPVRSGLAGKRIFVSRAGSNNRVMDNEAALRDALEQRGFETIQPDQLSIAEQIATFRDAAMVVAQHGAALTSLLFAAPDYDGPIVIELHQDNFLNPCFLKLCQVKQLRYTAVVSAMHSPGGDVRHESRWRADIPLILRAIADH